MGVAEAAIRHADVSLNTYVDFATNSGRYVTGVTNAMLNHIRQRDGGVKIEYTGGQTAYTLPHGMIDFDGVADLGNATAVGYNYIITVQHNGTLSPTFTANDKGIGGKACTQYAGIEEGQYVHTPSTDYKITRLNKIVTDVITTELYHPPVVEGKTNMTGALVYRLGGGEQKVSDLSGNKTIVAQPGTYNVAGIACISWWSDPNGVTSDNDYKNAQVTGSCDKDGKLTYSSSGVSDRSPLPFGSVEGDSGSPYFVWDDSSGSFKFLMAHTGSYNDGNPTAAACAPLWTKNTMDGDNVYVDMGVATDDIVVLDGAQKIDASDKGGAANIVQGETITVTPSMGYVRSSSGTNLYFPGTWDSITYNGVDIRDTSEDSHTWKSLSSLKNDNAWYNYDNTYLNASNSVYYEETDGGKVTKFTTGLTYSELYQTQNLVFQAAEEKGKYTVRVDADTDLGVGYLRFSADKYSGVEFNIVSADNNLLNSAGYVVDAGVRVNVSLRNTDAEYMREWRKVGEGELRICGVGKNEIFLNVGGAGRTVLEQKPDSDELGYAAYNVLVNTGATVVISNTKQIARDLTFGNGGGTLDMNANSMDWYTSDGETRAGFTIQALTEEALVANYSGKSTLTYRESGAQTYIGSFADSDKGSLTIDYQGGGTLTLNSIRTKLGNADSGLTVSNGTVKLEGTLTVHGYGSKNTYYTADFSTRDNDWHYADATMNVTVKDKATFELASHARLIGTVTVESGGTYVMHEGVQHAEEYIEGGEKTEKTADVAACYGHKGGVKLADGAKMKVMFSSDTDTDMSYSGSVSGPGSLTIALGTDKAAFRMTGSIDGVKTLVLESGRVHLYSTVRVGTLQVGTGAELILEEGADITTSLPSLVSKGESFAKEELTLQQYGGDDKLVILKDSRVLEVLSDMLNGVSLREGGSLSLNLATLGDVSAYDYIRLGFVGVARSTNTASLSEKAQVTATLSNGQVLTGYYVQGDTSSAYFAVVPEPTTGTLSLLALSLLSARRRRK